MMRRSGGTGKTLPCVLGVSRHWRRLTDEDELAIQSHAGSILGMADGITGLSSYQYFGVTSECK